MNKLKKIISLCLSFTLLLSVPIMAAPSDLTDTITYSSSDKEALNDFIRSADLYSYEDGCYFFERTDNNDDKVIKSILTLKLTNLTKKSDVDQNIQLLRSSSRGTGSDWFMDWDSTGSIWASIAIYYTSSYIGGVQYVKLDQVNVERAANNSGVTVRSQYVSYGCWGRPYQGSASGQNGSATLPNSTTFWYTTTPASWLAVSMNADHSIGGTYSLTLGRGDSTWNLSVSCNV